jgi:hypothetical protein
MIPFDISEPKLELREDFSKVVLPGIYLHYNCFEVKNGSFLPGKIAVPGISGRQGLNQN